MSNEVAKKNTKMGVVRELQSMLTNHVDRPEYILNVALANPSGDIVERESFSIYANEPEAKIREKIDKMRIKGGIVGLKISKLVKTDDNEFDLLLKL